MSSPNNVPVYILRFGLRLLALGRGNAALDGEGSAVGTRHTQICRIASHLGSVRGWSSPPDRRELGYSLCAHGMSADGDG